MAIDGTCLDAMNNLLQLKGRELIERGAIVKSFTKLQCCGSIIGTRHDMRIARNSYTVEYSQEDGTASFGFVDMFVEYRMESYAVIQKTEKVQWPACVHSDSDLCDVVDEYGDLQTLIGLHVFPIRKTDSYVSLEVQKIVGQVVCMEMVGSSDLYLSRYPNLIEND